MASTAGPGRPDSSGGELTEISTEECWELVDAASIGRLGFVLDDEVQVIPVNYQLDTDVIIRTSRTGVLAQLPGGPRVAFQVDYHSSGGFGWSVLMNGALSAISDEEAASLQLRQRVMPWAGGERDLLLRFVADKITGRRVRRRRNQNPHTASARQRSGGAF